MKRLLLWLSLLLIPGLFPGTSTAATPTGTALFQQAAEFLDQKSYLDAAATYRQVLESSVDKEERARALLFSATLYSRNLQLPDTAASCLRQIVTSYPNTMVAKDASFSLGVLAYRQGQYAEAIRRFETFIDTYPSGMRASSARQWLDGARTNLGMGLEAPPEAESMASLPQTVRILIQKRAKKLIAGKGGLSITVRRGEGPAILQEMKSVTFTARKEALVINGVSSGARPVTVSSGRETTLINGKPFRGEIRVWAEGGTLMVVNTLPIETYLRGVLPKEMGNLWPLEALKAQAVASRTYTYHALMNRSQDPGYDLEATTAFQVYGGAGVETLETDAAIVDTEGLYLSFQGRPIIACFHANSGGFTENAEAVWGTPLPYLKGVKDSFSRIAPEPCWKATIPADELVKKLWENGYSTGTIIAMTPSTLTDSGRVESLRLNTTRGRMEIPANAFRLAVGPTRIKSARFEVKPGKKSWVFSGCGYGHGVGMSQWGARKMADSGFTFDTILYHYYKTVTLTRIVHEKTGV